jgi:predicted nucleic acid-binding protein
MAGVVVLDAGALIALLSAKDEHHTWAMRLFVETCEYELQMSVLTFSEVMVHPQREGRAAKFLSNINGLGLKITDIVAESAVPIAELRAKTSLKMPDVVVLHQAMQSNARLATTDRALAQSGKKQGLFVYQPN